jgi:hypothetical protein
MAIPKRLRYEILRRDNHACRYCGRAAPDVALTVDHVTPVVLGGTDDPTNLATACTDCNAGKTSSTPDAPLVDDVASDALRWGKAIEEAARVDRVTREERAALIAHIDAEWCTWTYSWYEREFPRPADWESTIHQMLRAGADAGDLEYAIRTAMKSQAATDSKWRYFCGVIWKMVRQRQDAARALLEVEGGES